MKHCGNIAIIIKKFSSNNNNEYKSLNELGGMEMALIKKPAKMARNDDDDDDNDASIIKI